MKTQIYTTALAALFSAAAFSVPAHSETLGPVTDELGVIAIHPGEPITIGSYTALSGTDFTAGIYENNGMSIAVEHMGGELVGHPIQLITEDAPCTPEGGQIAATKLVANPSIVVALGPSCSSSAAVGVPILWKAGISSVGVGTSAPSLTAKDRPEGLRGFMRVIPSAAIEGELASKYLIETGVKKVATIHDGSNYGEQFVANFINYFKAAGGSITNQEAISAGDTDMRPVLSRIGAGKPQALIMPVFPAAASFIARQSRELPAMAGVTLVATGNIAGVDTLRTAGESIVGTIYPGIAASIFGDRYQKFLKEYISKFGENPPGGHAAYGYDAAMLAASAIKAVAKTDADGVTYIGRKALRDALMATKDLKGLSGDLTCNANGDCGSMAGMAMWQFVSSNPSTFKPGDNPKIIYPTAFAK